MTLALGAILLSIVLVIAVGTILAVLIQKSVSRAQVLPFYVVWLFTMTAWLIVIIILASLITTYIFQLYTVYDSGMAPTYVKGDLIVVERFNHAVNKGDVVLVPLTQATGYTILQIERIRATAGESVGNTVIPEGSYYVANDIRPATGSVIDKSLIQGKPILNLGTL